MGNDFPSSPRPPQAGANINFFSRDDPADSNPFPTVIDSVNADGSINCTVTRNGVQVPEVNVPAPDEMIDYFRYYEPREALDEA